jgi:hypothetical protein
MTEMRNRFKHRPLLRIVRLAFWLSGAAVVFGLLMIASLWFAIPFACALLAAVAVWLVVAARAWVAVKLVQGWRRRTL